MIQSMTGFARVERAIEDSTVVVEVRSVNHRHLDVKLRSGRDKPLEWDGLTKALVAKYFARGALEISIERRTEAGEGQQQYALNLAAVANHYESLKSAQKILGLENQVTLRDVFLFPDSVERAGGASVAELPWDTVSPVLDEACRGLRGERDREGAHLIKQIVGLIELLSRGCLELAVLAPQGMEAGRKRAKERLARMLGPSIESTTESRIAQEVALLFERSDISEELHRLEGHLAHFRELLLSNGQVGRKLEFCIQEALRELNTIGAKSADPALSRLALDLKAAADQVREQVLNLE